MKYHASDQINRILRLQSEAKLLVSNAKEKLKEADELTAELRADYGSTFIFGTHLMRLEHRAVEISPGNRDWLVTDSNVKAV